MISPCSLIASGRRILGSLFECVVLVLIGVSAIPGPAHATVEASSGSTMQQQSPGNPTADFFVAPDGNDSWSGTLPAPNNQHTDGPFASVARAQIAVQNLIQSHPNRPII